MTAFRPVTLGDHLMLVDGSSYIYRAYYASPKLIRRGDNHPVGALSGFCGLMWRLINGGAVARPSHIAVIFDAGRRTFRQEIYPDYKAQRSEPPSDLSAQFPLVRLATAALGVAAIEQEGFEADDLIATYARRAAELGATVTIVSPDKDLMQLVTEAVTIFDSKSNRVIGPIQVREKFGVGPEQVTDVQALMGDSVDNVPGVPGIGIKTAAELIGLYGSIEALLESGATVRRAGRPWLEFADQVRLSKRLVTLKHDVPVRVSLAAFAAGDMDQDRFLAFLTEWDLTSLADRISRGVAA